MLSHPDNNEEKNWKKKSKFSHKSRRTKTINKGNTRVENREGFHSEREEKNGSDRNHAHTHARNVTEFFF